MVRAFLSLFGICLALLLAEGASRLVLTPPQRLTVNTAPVPDAVPLSATWQQGNLYDPNNPFYLHTPSGRRMRPNSQVVIENQGICNCRAEIRTNSLGFRGPELGGKGEKSRIMFVGDSITLADYIPEERTWVRQVERLAAGQVEVVNAGVTAAGAADELGVLTETVAKVQPDLVVVGVYLNDVQTTPGLSLTRLPWYLDWSWLAHYLARHVSWLSRDHNADYGSVSQQMMTEWGRELKREGAQGEAADLDRKVQLFLADWGSGFSPRAWAHMRPMYEEMARLAKVHRFKLAFVMFPVADQVYWKQLFDQPQQEFSKIAADLNAPLLDTLPKLREIYQAGQRDLFYDWCHHKPAIQDRLAEWVWEFLKAQQLL